MKCFQLKRPLTVVDLETTGLRYEEDRIVEVGLTTFYPIETGEATLEWSTLVLPGVPIDPNVHGITEEMLAACRRCKLQAGAHPVTMDGDAVVCDEFRPWPTFAQLAGRLSRFLTNCDFAGKNVRFDLQFLDAEFKRAKVEWSYAGAAIVCADEIERVKEPRNLSALYERRTGKKAANAHRALADVKMTYELIEAQMALWPDLPKDPRALHDLLWSNWIDFEGKFRFDKDGVPVIWFGKHRGLPMKSVPADYWDFMMKASNGFSAEIRTLAGKAKLGQFPTKGA